MPHLAQAQASRLATQDLITGCGTGVKSWHTVGAGANHWGGPAGCVVPGAGVLALRKLWLEVFPSLRMGTSCAAG